MVEENRLREEPCFVISVAARIVGVHAQTLRHYEQPESTDGRPWGQPLKQPEGAPLNLG